MIIAKQMINKPYVNIFNGLISFVNPDLSSVKYRIWTLSEKDTFFFIYIS
jgi:hypothetical protein